MNEPNNFFLQHRDIARILSFVVEFLFPFLLFQFNLSFPICSLGLEGLLLIFPILFSSWFIASSFFSSSACGLALSVSSRDILLCLFFFLKYLRFSFGFFGSRS